MLSSCKVRLTDTLPETDASFKKNLNKEYSVLNLPIEIPVKSLEDEINRQFKGLIYEDVSYDTPEKDDVKVKIWKTRNIKIQAHNDLIKYDVPLKIWASYRWKACGICPLIEKETNFNVTVSFLSKLIIKQNWALETQTQASGYYFESKPKLDFGIVNIPITAIVEPILKDELTNVAKVIDKEVSTAFNFSKEIDSVWRELHKPQLIDSAYKVWLKITPNEVYHTPIKAVNEIIKFTTGFKGIFEIIIGQKPQANKLKPLPQLKATPNAEESFFAFCETFIEFEAASELARMHIKDTVFDVTKRKKVKIEDIHFYGKGNIVYTKVDLSKSIKGSIYFIGTPEYDKKNKILYLKDFNFDLKSKNVLLKSAKWLLHSTLKDKIENEFKYNLNEDLNGIHTAINDLLKGYNFDSLFTLSGQLDMLDIHDIIVEEKGIRVIIKSKGKAQLRFNSLEF